MEKEIVLTPSKEVIQKVREELGLDESQIRESVKSLKIWLKLQPHLPKDEDVADDRRLENWLINCKNSKEIVKQSIDLYYSMRNLLPEIMCGWDPQGEWFNNICSSTCGITLPTHTSEGDRISIFRITKSDIRDFDIYDSIKGVILGIEIRMCEDYFSKEIIIFDLKNTPFWILSKYSLPVGKKCITLIQKVYHWRVRSIHFINTPSFAEITINMIKSLLKKKLQDRIFVHGSDLTELYKQVPKRILPEELGGEGGSAANIQKQWMNKIVSYREWFLKQEKLKADESKRTTGKFNSSDLFGFEGSFRQLSID